MTIKVRKENYFEQIDRFDNIIVNDSHLSHYKRNI